MSGSDAALPTLPLVLRFVTRLMEVEPDHVIAGRGPAAASARALFCWLAGHVTEASPEAIGFALCVDRTAVERMRDEVRARRQADRPFRERLDDVALEIHVEAGLVDRKIVPGAASRDAADTARRLLADPRSGPVVSAVDLVHLAASYELLLAKLTDLDRAARDLRAARSTPYERTAFVEHDTALRSLLTLARSQKGPSTHG